MKTSELLNTKALCWLAAVISIAALAGVCLILHRDFTKPVDLLKTVPMVITVDLIIWEVFKHWAWKWKYFRPWLLRIPNLNGEWEGTIHPNGNGATVVQSPEPIAAILCIRQSLTNISCVVRTDQMKSSSIVAGIRIDPEEQVSELTYTYQSVPKSSVRQQSPLHFGTALLEFHDGPSQKLTGEYWTTRHTTGEIEFRRATRKVDCDE